MNTNPEAIRILCFGDSNTWGYVSGSNHLRLPANSRWTGVLQQELGTQFEVIEEGLNSRAINKEDRRLGKEGRNAMQYILPCLDTHDPLDWIVVMLGANDLKHKHHLSPTKVTSNMARLLDLIQGRKSQFRTEQPRIILLSPPFINEETEYCQEEKKYLGAAKKSRQLGIHFQGLAERLRIDFINAAKITEVGIDGVHITEQSHANLARAVASKIREIR